LEIEGERDVRGDHAPEELRELAQAGVDLDVPLLLVAVAAEHQELPGERARALDRALGALEVLDPARGERLVPSHQVEVAADGLEDVVEVVREAPREAAEALEASPALTLELEPALLFGGDEGGLAEPQLAFQRVGDARLEGE